jgi:hypothetical protein
VQAAKEAIILRIEYIPLKNIWDRSVGGRDSRFAHRKSEDINT